VGNTLQKAAKLVHPSPSVRRFGLPPALPVMLLVALSRGPAPHQSQALEVHRLTRSVSPRPNAEPLLRLRPMDQQHAPGDPFSCQGTVQSPPVSAAAPPTAARSRRPSPGRCLPPPLLRSERSRRLRAPPRSARF